MVKFGEGFTTIPRILDPVEKGSIYIVILVLLHSMYAVSPSLYQVPSTLTLGGTGSTLGGLVTNTMSVNKNKGKIAR